MKNTLQLLCLLLVLALTGYDEDNYRPYPVPYVLGEWEMTGYYEGDNYIEGTTCSDIVYFTVLGDRTGTGVEVPCNTAYSYFTYYFDQAKIAKETYEFDFSGNTPPWETEEKETVVATIVENKMHIEDQSSWNNDNPNHVHRIAVYQKVSF